ncbi:MAG: hypothetical protein R3272_06685 [Candidatus Promineifilaceae bacterium]|nr:hypothetical protein [Candidatus Promineifilaceae bacterium]
MSDVGKAEVTVAESHPHHPPPEKSLSTPLEQAPELSQSAGRRALNVYKVGLFFISLLLFVLAVMLMKEGARDLAPLVRDRFAVTNAADSLGFGWLFAYIIMSGSPVAAAALAFFDAGAVGRIGAYTMITGSRLGASLIVLFIGFIYVLRGRDRVTSLAMGLLSLMVTGSTHLLALPVGLFILASGLLDGVKMDTGALVNSVTDYLFGGIVSYLTELLPNWGLFVAGFVIIMVSFSLFDRALPQMSLRESHVGRLSRYVYRPSVMFLLGAAITTISMSVSISLSLLVPLSARGFIRRENVVPYIMGANITTFVDTLLAAVLLKNQAAFTIIFANMFSITLVSILILGLFYRRYEDLLLDVVEWVTADTRHMLLFMALIVVVPIVLVLM